MWMGRACSNCVPDKGVWKVHFSTVVLRPICFRFSNPSYLTRKYYSFFSLDMCSTEEVSYVAELQQLNECFFYCELWVLIWETFSENKPI